MNSLFFHLVHAMQLMKPKCASEFGWENIQFLATKIV